MKFINVIDNRLKLFAVIFIFAVSSILISSILKGTAFSIMLSLFILATLLLTKSIWLPDNYGRTLIRRLSLALVTLLATTPFYHETLYSIILDLLVASYGKQFPVLKEISRANDVPTILIFAFVFLSILVINYFSRDTSAMGIHSIAVDKEFPERNYKQRLEAFCRILKNNLDELNRESNWSDEYFTPVDAEIEIRREDDKKRKVSDLLTAIKNDKKSKVFLILGDPGSGKSVALRKLYGELLSEVEATGKVPIYVNLREWEIRDKWTAKKPPKVSDLYNFVRNNLKAKGDIFSNEFIDKYFEKMFEHGRLFFLLDSFDEIPSVLDVDESHWLIDSLSTVIYNFLSGAQESRGILASRIFRRPTQNFDTKTILEIRPFSDTKIVSRLKKAIDYNSRLETLIFSERPEYVQLAQNPFTASLILDYAKKHDYTLPNSQIALYDNYIIERLQHARRLTVRELDDITDDLVIKSAIEMAFFMFSKPEYGLETPKNVLTQAAPLLPIDKVIDLLCFARIGRLGVGHDRLFSFVHRRFNEFLVSKKLIEDKSLIPADSIPTDSRWRDSLVLYCEIASSDEAKSLALFSWSQIRLVKDKQLTLSDEGYLRAIHCLRFLKDAFRTRISCISEFRMELSDFILQQITKDNLLETKLAVEAAGLVEESKTDDIMTKALDVKNYWISETTLRSCRILPSISQQVEYEIFKLLLSYSPLEIIKRKDELLFSFGLSDGFKNVKKFFKGLIQDYWMLSIGTGILFVAQPLAAFACVLIFFLINYAMAFFSEVAKNKKVEGNQSVETDRDKLMQFLRVQYPAIFLPLMRTYLAMGLLFTLILYFLSDEVKEEGSVLGSFFEGRIASFLTIISLVLIFPWHFFQLLAARINRDLLRKIGKALLKSLPFFFGGLGLIFILQFYFKEYIEIIFIVISIISVLLAILAVSIELVNRSKDIIYLKKVRMYDDFSRKLIESHLSNMKTSYGRLRLVSAIYNKNYTKMKGNWTNSQLPNYNDDASTLLARLEAKWLGFER